MRGCCVKREDDEREDRGFFDWLSGSPPQASDASRGRGRGDDAGDDQHSSERSAEEVRRHVAGCGRNPNILLYSVNNVRTPKRRGSLFRSSSGSGPSSGQSVPSPTEGGRRVQEAMHIPGNCRDGVEIETDYFVGKVLLMYKTTTDPPNPHMSYFASKKRSWEVRVQGRFKRAPKGDMFVGIVLRDFNYQQEVAWASRRVGQIGMAPLKYLKYDLHWRWGDRMQDALKPDAELAHLVSNCTAWDQIIITEAGKEPPSIVAEYAEIGDSYGLNLMRNSMGLSSYGERVDEVFRNISTEDTYTMCFWGVSQVIDLLSWNFRIAGGVSMARFFEDSPVHVAMYEYEKGVSGSDLEDGDANKEKRHMEKDKKYYLDFMFWSNSVECPALPSRYIFRSAPDEFEIYSASLNGEQAEAAVRGEIDLDEARRASPFVTAQSQAGDESGSGSRERSSSPGPQRGRIAGLWMRVSQTLRWIPDYTCARAETDAPQADGRAPQQDGRRISNPDPVRMS